MLWLNFAFWDTFMLLRCLNSKEIKLQSSIRVICIIFDLIFFSWKLKRKQRFQVRRQFQHFEYDMNQTLIGLFDENFAIVYHYDTQLSCCCSRFSLLCFAHSTHTTTDSVRGLLLAKRSIASFSPLRRTGFCHRLSHFDFLLRLEAGAARTVRRRLLHCATEDEAEIETDEAHRSQLHKAAKN